MTATAAFSFGDWPLVFGDLLITGEASSAPAVSVPAVGSVQNFFEDSGWHVLGLQQKVVLVSDQCVIAWAGSWLGARVAVAELRAMAAAETLTADLVHAFLASDPDVRKLGTSFVGWVLEAGRFVQIVHEAETINAGFLGRMALDGSGKQAIKELVALTAGTKLNVSGEAGLPDQAIGFGVMMTGALLQAELNGGQNAETLRHMFGGGYELATFAGGRFQKAGEMTFVVWSARVSTQQVWIGLPSLLVKQRYVEDVLLLRSARLETAVDGKSRVIDEQRHAILPMYELAEKFRPEALPTISFESRRLCHCFVVELPSGKAIYSRFQNVGPNSEPTMAFQDELDVLNLGFNQTFIADVARALRRMADSDRYKL